MTIRWDPVGLPQINKSLRPPGHRNWIHQSCFFLIQGEKDGHNWFILRNQFFFSKISWANEIPEPNGNGGTEHGAKVRSIQLLWRFWSSSERQGVERPRRSPSIWQRLGVSGLWRRFCVVCVRIARWNKCLHNNTASAFTGWLVFVWDECREISIFRILPDSNKAWPWNHETIGTTTLFKWGLNEAGYTSRGVIGCTQPRRVAVLLT